MSDLDSADIRNKSDDDITPLSSTSVTAPKCTEPSLEKHLGRFEPRTLTFHAIVLSTEEVDRTVLSQISGATELCPASLFREGTAPEITVSRCTRVWKERIVALKGADQWSFTITKSVYGRTHTKSTVNIETGSFVRIFEASPPGSAFSLKCRTVADTKMKQPFSVVPCTAVVSLFAGGKWIEFACRKPGLAGSVYTSLQAAIASIDNIKMLRLALAASPLYGSEETVNVTVRLCDLRPMLRSSSSSKPSQPEYAAPRFAADRPLSFVSQLSLALSNNVPELKMKGTGIADHLVDAAAGNFDAPDGIHEKHPIPHVISAAHARSMSAKFVLLLDGINVEPPIVNHGRALEVWVEAERGRMLPARLTMHPSCKLRSLQGVRVAISEAVTLLRQWQNVIDGIPEIRPAGSLERTTSLSRFPVSPLVAEPSSPMLRAVCEASGPESSEAFGRCQLTDLESDERQLLESLCADTAEVLSKYSSTRALVSSRRPSAAALPQSDVQMADVTTRAASQTRMGLGRNNGDGCAPHSKDDTAEFPFSDPPDSRVVRFTNYKAVVGHILRYRLSQPSAHPP